MHTFLPMFQPDAVLQSENIRLETVAGKSARRVIINDSPWEDGFISFFLNVLEENGTYKMWYLCKDHNFIGHVAYAQSTDGIHWEKPDLGVYEYQGNKHNNITDLTCTNGSVFLHSDGKSEEKYHFIGSSKQGLTSFSSVDGYHWRPNHTILMPFHFDTQNQAIVDEKNGKYILYVRAWSHPEWEEIGKRRRFVARTVIDSLTKETGIVPIRMRPDGSMPFATVELPEVFGTDEFDPPESDVYNMAAMKYPGYDGLIAFPTFLRRVVTPETAHVFYPGRTEVQFVSSNDGIHWERFNRAPVLSPSTESEGYPNVVYAGIGMIRHGDELWQYGTGYRTFHGDKDNRIAQRDGTIYRWIYRKDGFVAAGADYHGGQLTTIAFDVDDGIYINADTGAMGWMKAALFYEDGSIVPGFDFSSSEEYMGNQIHHELCWHGVSTKCLCGKKVRLSIQGASFRLYAVYGKARE